MNLRIIIRPIQTSQQQNKCEIESIRNRLQQQTARTILYNLRISVFHRTTSSITKKCFKQPLYNTCLSIASGLRSLRSSIQFKKSYNCNIDQRLRVIQKRNDFAFACLNDRFTFKRTLQFIQKCTRYSKQGNIKSNK